MNKTTTIVYLHALTPVHAGTGQVSASVVDLPIAREKATNYPFLPATSLKGVLKDEVEQERQAELFGTQERAGALQFGDARLLCFPVRSWLGTFAYVTCPLVLSRLKRDFTALGGTLPFAGDIPAPTTDEVAVVSPETVLAAGDTLWLEDLKLISTPKESISSIAAGIAKALFTQAEEQQIFVQRFVVVSNTVFDFLVETATEITARVKLKEETKTVQPGGLWYEESVPAETIFVAPVLGWLPVTSGTVIQIGGNETVGRGLCRLVIHGGHE